jgi:hypothetical protein
MPVQRGGLVLPALITSTIIMVVCATIWGALGVLSFADADSLSTAAHRYVCMALATVTTCSLMINLAARNVRATRAELRVLRAELRTDDAGYDAGVVAGYAAGLDAAPSPTVTRLVPGRR